MLRIFLNLTYNKAFEKQANREKGNKQSLCSWWFGSKSEGQPETDQGSSSEKLQITNYNPVA